MYLRTYKLLAYENRTTELAEIMTTWRINGIEPFSFFCNIFGEKTTSNGSDDGASLLCLGISFSWRYDARRKELQERRERPMTVKPLPTVR